MSHAVEDFHGRIAAMFLAGWALAHLVRKKDMPRGSVEKHLQNLRLWLPDRKSAYVEMRSSAAVHSLQLHS